MPTIATWNVNSVNARLAKVLDWLARGSARRGPACRRSSASDETFPAEALGDLGYNVAIHGQKTYNGVAILARAAAGGRAPRAARASRDEQARYIEAVVSGEPVRVASIYLPNGNPIGTEKFAYKLAWMERLRAHARGLLELEEPLVLAGDYNVIPEPRDCRRSRRLGGRRAVPAGEPRRPSARCCTWASPTPIWGLRPARRAPTPSGTTRPAPGSGTTASASTMSCCRRRPPTGW